jgi:hypothetical protein
MPSIRARDPDEAAVSTARRPGCADAGCATTRSSRKPACELILGRFAGQANDLGTTAIGTDRVDLQAGSRNPSGFSLGKILLTLSGDARANLAAGGKP